MTGGAIEDEAMVLAAAIFSGRDARAVLGGLAGDRAARCRARLEELAGDGSSGRRRRLAAALRRLFAAPSVGAARASPSALAARLAPETPAIRSLVLGDLPVLLASKVAELLAQGPARPAAPAAPVHGWLQRFLLGGGG